MLFTTRRNIQRSNQAIRPSLSGTASLAAVGLIGLIAPDVYGQTTTTSANTFTAAPAVSIGREPSANSTTVSRAGAVLGPATPAYFRSAYVAALKAPLPEFIYATGGFPRYVPQNEYDLDAPGILQTFQPGGATATAQNAFFQSLGTNGRSCATCHQPPTGMSVSLSNILLRFTLTGGKDPLFAPVDGADCPDLVPNQNTSGALLGGATGAGKRNFIAAHSLILNRGVFRIFLPVPSNAEYTISVVSDPAGCNLSATYGQATNPETGQTEQIISVYRRPLISTNLAFVTSTLASQGRFPPIDPIDGSPLPDDPTTGLVESGNIMWDGREPTLSTQAIDATLSHAQALAPPTQAQINQIVQFENGLYSAQIYDLIAGKLDAGGAFGGPVDLYANAPPDSAPGVPPFNEYVAWSAVGSGVSVAQRQSIARGEAIFENRTFTISNVAGLNNIAAVGNPTAGTCSTCHNQAHAGSDSFPVAQHDIGVGGDAQQFGGPPPASDLPIFQLTCPPGTTVYNGVPKVVNGQPVSIVLTNDPGKALITGRCADIGRLSVPPLRALASHPPFFSDGSAATLDDVVSFYKNRFSIGLTPQERNDLVNFLNAL
jgi:cytochrome c peroxidase